MRKIFQIRDFGDDSDQSSSSIWLIIYSDLMTNLMLFFLMLWGLSQSSFETYTEATKSIQERITKQKVEAVKEEPKYEVKEENVPENFRAVTKPKSDLEGIRIVFNAPIFFDSGKADLKSSATETLSELASWLNDVPYTVIVEGHTDNTPITKRYSSNWELSIDRARSVVIFLQNKGIDPKRLVLAGYGEHQPLYPNDTEEHRQLNRRIEINIVYWEK
ncbi:MAG: flagellar motor protein MotB [Elusimicrobia bacterium]|nr:flagellar motor protein MotB [Elusimicrobiota bacterium]